MLERIRGKIMFRYRQQRCKLAHSPSQRFLIKLRIALPSYMKDAQSVYYTDSCTLQLWNQPRHPLACESIVLVLYIDPIYARQSLVHHNKESNFVVLWNIQATEIIILSQIKWRKKSLAYFLSSAGPRILCKLRRTYIHTYTCAT